MRKAFAVLALVFGASVMASAQAVTITPFPGERVTPVSNFRGAADTAPALIIKYFPPAGNAASSGTTTVATAATDLRFVVNGAVYAGFEAPVSGALGGIIDMTDASANTLGEVVDVINSTSTTFASGYFRAAIVNGLRSDVVSTLAFVADAADTDVTSDAGEVIYWDSSILDDEELLFSAANFTAGLPNQYARQAFNSKNINTKGAFDGVTSVVQYAEEKITNAGTVGTFTIYAVTEYYGSGKGCVATATCGPNSGSYEIARVLYASAGGATTVAANTPAGLFLLAEGEKVFYRLAASGADTSVWEHVITGFQFRKQ